MQRCACYHPQSTYRMLAECKTCTVCISNHQHVAKCIGRTIGELDSEAKYAVKCLTVKSTYSQQLSMVIISANMCMGKIHAHSDVL